jgi:transposase InsO family protein/transposase
MGIKSRDWKKIGDYLLQMKSEGLSYTEGAKRFGLNVSDIYEYNKRFNKTDFERSPGKVRNWTKIGEYVSRIEELGMNYVKGAAHFGISVSSIYKYNSQIKGKIQSKSSSLEERKGRGQLGTECPPAQSEESASGESIPPSSPSDVEVSGENSASKADLPSGVAALIMNYRQEYPDHGYKRIQDHLKSRYFVSVPRKKIRELLKGCGLTGTMDSSFDKSAMEEHVKGSRRFEASYPRELYQMDITYVYLVNQTICYLVVIVDDNSRFCVSAELRNDYRGISMIEVVHRAIERYGKPSKLLTDQGSSFYSWSSEQTLFSRYLDDMKIEHIVADPHSPQTLGKVERFHQTLQREVLNKSHFVSFEEARQRIEDYMHHYNYDRPHQGIGGACPASRFQGIIGETSRIESELYGKGIDFSRGYLVFKMVEHTISVVCTRGGLQVFLDGNLLKCGPDTARSDGVDKIK